MENQEQEINLQEIFFLLLSKIKFIIILTVLCAAALFAYAKFWLPVEYTSSVSFYVKNNSDTTSQTATASDLTAAKSLATTYIVILNEDVVYDKVSEMLLNDYGSSQLKPFFNISKDDDGKEYISAGQIRKLVTASALNNTEVIQITAVTKDPALSAAICNDIAAYAKVLLVDVTKAGSVETIGNAKEPAGPSGPNVKRYAIIGALIGFVIAVAIVIIRKLLDNRIHTAEDIKQRFEIPVLGEIPDLEMDGKEASKYEY
ncbi:MAG: lipopolysaccharide biosynthesis protein [Ruminococcus sp.]|nr:lipopolysaccharide biosynthesis protein [Ruminococcus sp.]